MSSMIWCLNLSQLVFVYETISAIRPTELQCCFVYIACDYNLTVWCSVSWHSYCSAMCSNSYSCDFMGGARTPHHAAVKSSLSDRNWWGSCSQSNSRFVNICHLIHDRCYTDQRCDLNANCSILAFTLQASNNVCHGKNSLTRKIRHHAVTDKI